MEGVTVIAGVPQIFGLLAKEARGLKRYYLQHWAFRKVRVCMIFARYCINCQSYSESSVSSIQGLE